MVAAFPVAKLGALVLRQLSKPIANFAKERAKSHPFFRTYVCMPPAQFYNWCEVKMKMWVMNLGKPVAIPSLNEAMAIELGANLLGEAIIFTIAAGVLFMEYSRQTRKEAAKEEARLQEMDNLQSTIKELYFQAERQDTQIRELCRLIADLEGRTIQKPWSPPKNIIHQSNPVCIPCAEDSTVAAGTGVDHNKDVSPSLNSIGVVGMAVDYLTRHVI